MPTLRETLQQRRHIERRAVGRTTINRDVLMFFNGSVHACCVRDVTNHGAGLIHNVLAAAGFKTVGEVRETTDETLLSLQDLGPDSVTHLRKTLGLPSTDGVTPR